MAIVPVHTTLPPPPDLAELIARLPPTWVDDGLTMFPDSIAGWSIKAAGTGHDALVCTRLWHAGAMDREWSEQAVAKIGRWVQALLPSGLQWVRFIVMRGVYRFGDKAFDSCGRKPYGARAGQMALGLCRHGVPRPSWMAAP